MFTDHNLGNLNKTFTVSLSEKRHWTEYVQWVRCGRHADQEHSDFVGLPSRSLKRGFTKGYKLCRRHFFAWREISTLCIRSGPNIGTKDEFLPSSSHALIDSGGNAVLWDSLAEPFPLALAKTVKLLDIVRFSAKSVRATGEFYGRLIRRTNRISFTNGNLWLKFTIYRKSRNQAPKWAPIFTN